MAIVNGQDANANDFSGMIWPTILRVVPTGWLLCAGQAVSRSTYSALFALLCPSATVTMTIAAPCVVTWTGNTLANGDAIVFSSSGSLPTGLTAGKIYYVVGLSGNTFNVATSYGGSAITTSGSQSGTQTCQVATFGNGDGSTTFNVPDLRGRSLVGAGTGGKTATIVSVSGNVITASGLQGNNNEFQTGEAVVFSAVTAGNLVNGTTYYVVRVTNTTFSLATSLGNALGASPGGNASVITLAGTEAGSFALALSARTMGDTVGEEFHAQTYDELNPHQHGFGGNGTGSNQTVNTSYFGGSIISYGVAAGGGTPTPNLPPGIVLNFLIHI